MLTLQRTTSEDLSFRELVAALNADLAVRNGDANDFFAQFNGLAGLECVVIAYESGIAVGCGAAKPFDSNASEIKRMFVLPGKRGNGIAGAVLAAIEGWCTELGYRKCILETGQKQPEAIRLYQKSGYQQISNFGPYVGVEDSLCFEKHLS